MTCSREMNMELKQADEMRWMNIRDGVYLSPLRMSKEGAGSFLMKFKAGSRSIAHIHPGGEELYVIEGSGRLDELRFNTGDYVYTPPREGHTLYAETEVTILVYLPEPAILVE